MKGEDLQQIDQALEDFGFNNLEVEVYRALLKSGSRPASVIAEQANLKRAHTYNILNSLMDKGLVQQFLKNGVKQFSCSPPTSLLTIVEQREDRLASQKKQLTEILPLLQQLRNPLAAEPKVHFFRGSDGIKEIYEDMLRTPNITIYGLIDVKYTNNFADDDNMRWLNSFVRRRAERNISWHGIINRSEDSDIAVGSRHPAKRQCKMIEGVELPVAVEVYNSKVAITSTHHESVGFVIENENVAAALRNAHQAIWPFLPDYPQSRAKAPKSRVANL